MVLFEVLREAVKKKKKKTKEGEHISIHPSISLREQSVNDAKAGGS